MAVFKMRWGLATFATALALATPTFADTVVGPLTFDAQSLRVEDFRGTLNVVVEPGLLRFSVVIEGDEDQVEALGVELEGHTLVIERQGRFPRLRDVLTLGLIRFLEDHPVVTVSVPPGTPLTVDDLSGEIQAGDLDAPLAFAGGGTMTGRIGDVTDAEIDLSGSSELELGAVSGRLDIELSGSSDIRVASSGAATIDISGSSDVRIGPIDGGLTVNTSGSSRVGAGSVRGDVSIRSSGSSDIDIGGGQADTFTVKVSGSVNVTFAGNANNPDIDTSGSAKIRIGSVTGQVRSRGGGNIVIGD